MSTKVKNSTSLFRFYDFLVLQKIRDSKPPQKTIQKGETQAEMLVDAFGQPVYSITLKPSNKRK